MAKLTAFDASHWWDACVTKLWPVPSNHSYRYSVGIGDKYVVLSNEIDPWYSYGKVPARYAVPAIHEHLYLIAAEPMEAWEDFKAIGWCGLE